MAKNEYLPFGTATGANVLTPTEYGQLAGRKTGFEAGVAKSKELNTAWRQASVVAAVVAQFIADHSKKDSLDDGNLPELQANLELALKAKIDTETAGMVKSINTTHKPDAAGNVTLTADDVSAFAIRKNLTAADSPNALHGTAMFGHYGVPGAAGATVVKGYPIDGFIGAIFVMWGPNATQQVAFHNDGRQFTRTATGAWNGIDGPWSVWHEAAMSSLMLPNDASVTRLDDPAIINVTRPITLAGKFADHPLGPTYGSADQLQTFRRHFDAGSAVYQQLIDGNGQIFIRVGSYSAASGWAWKLAGTSGYPFGWRRVFDSGNPPTAAESGAVPTTGGNVGYLDKAAHYGTDPTKWPGTGAFAAQYTHPVAPFLIPVGYVAPRDVSSYAPIIKALIQTAGYGYGTAVSFGAVTSGTAKFAQAVIHVIGDNGISKEWFFDPTDGTFSAPGGNIVAGQGLYESGGAVRAYSSNNPPPQQDLSGYVHGDAITYVGLEADNPNAPYMRRASTNTLIYLATTAWANQNFVTDERQGAIVSAGKLGDNYDAPAGCSLVGLAHNGSSDTKDLGMFYCANQICINGNWRTIGRL